MLEMCGVTGILPNATFKVELESGQFVLAHIYGREG